MIERSELPMGTEGEDADDHWRLIADSIPHLAWMTSADGHVEYMNTLGRDYSGWSPEAANDQVWVVLVHPDDADGAVRAWDHAILTGTPYFSEYRLRRADGEYRWHCGRGMPVRDTAGGIIKWIGTATDVHDHKRSEAALRESGARLAEAQRLAQVGSWSVDVASGTRIWSDELYRLLGYQPAEFAPDVERLFARVHPADIGRVRPAVLSQAIQPEPWEDEFRIVLPGGAIRWLSARAEPVLGPGGEVIRVHGTSQNVTGRRNAEERLRLQAHLLDAVGEAVIATGLDGSVVYWGPGAERLYGWAADDAVGRALSGLVRTSAGDEDRSEILALLARGEPWEGMIERRRRDGSTFIAQLRTHPVLDEAGRLAGTISIASDVSLREAGYAELERAHRTTAEALTLLATLQAEAPVGFAFVDREFRYVRLNQELASIIGARMEDLVGRLVAEVVPDLWETLGPIFRHVLESGQALRNQPLWSRPGGEGRERLTSHYPVRVGDDIIGIGVVVVDITDRVRAEAFRSAVMSQVVDGVYTQDRQGRLLYMNRAASKMLGWSETELRGKHIHETVHFQRSDGTPVGASECALLTDGPKGRLQRSEGESFTRKDGSTFPVAYSSVPLHRGSSVEGVAVIFRDISEPGASPNLINVLIADSDKATTRSFQALLDRHEGIEVTMVSTTSDGAVDAATRLSPDVALVAFDLPEHDGLVTATRIRAGSPSTSVILMTDTYDHTVALAGIEAGCAVVLDKSRAWVDLVSAVRAAYHGETIISQAELQRVLSEVRRRDHRGPATQLTDREEEVLVCLREGLPNAAVAERLGVTANTVRNHVQRILYKLDVHSKLEAVVLTSRDGLRQGGP